MANPSFLSRLFRRSDRKDVGADTLELFRTLAGWGRSTQSGQTITWQRALSVTTALRCTQVIADCVATVPLKVFQRGADRSRVELREHPLSLIFSGRANAWQNGLELRETLAYHVVLTANGYSFVNRVGGRIVELLPLEPGRCVPLMSTAGDLTYRVTGRDGVSRVLPPELIWHIRGASWNGYHGMEPISLAREALGLSLATEEAHAKLHANGVRPSGIYSVEGTLDKPAHDKLTAWIEQSVAGTENSFKTLVLDRAAKFQQMVMTGVDAQHIETRRFQIEEVCRALGVMPIMVGHSDKAATYASAEQMFLAHAIYTARPAHRRWETSIEASLLSDTEREQGIYVKFIDAELLRGAAKDRADYYAKALGAGGAKGWLTQNDVRGFEDLDPLPGGDDLPQPPPGPRPPTTPGPNA